MTEEAQVPQEAPAPPAWTPEVEQEAKALGWKSPEEWTGNVPAGYINNPEAYLERAESFAPFRKIKDQLKESRADADDRLRRLESVTEKVLQRTRAEHQRELENLKAEKLKAVEIGDTDAYRALDKREDAVKAEMTDPPRTGVRPEEKQAIDRWAASEKNKDWFRKDAVMTQAAVTYYGEAQAQGMTDPVAILAHVDAQITKKFRLGEPDRQARQDVDPGLTFGNTGVDPFAKLPKDARDAFARFVAKGVFKDTKEERATYAEDYNAA